jgi:hypothetical protein
MRGVEEQISSFQVEKQRKHYTSFHTTNSSLMVEELARWKSALTVRINDLQETVKRLLDERCKVQKKSVRTCCFLQGVKERLVDEGGEQRETLKNSNIVDLNNINCSLSQQISDLVGADVEKCDDVFEVYSRLPQHTATEKIAMKVCTTQIAPSVKAY